MTARLRQSSDKQGRRTRPRDIMETLATFFTKLAKYEGTPVANLVARWSPADVESISRAFDTALDRSKIDLSVNGSLSVQALGNRVADAVADGLDEHLLKYRVCGCSGQGYPDRRLQAVKSNRSFALELKAKTRFNPRDTNRVIITSGTRKLRRNFPVGKPICHLLATVLYSKSRHGQKWQIGIDGLRFDFLEPWTRIQKRYEGSLNQHLLSKGKHSTRLIVARSARRVRKVHCAPRVHRAS